MPNHVTVRIEAAKEVIDFLTGGTRAEVDFGHVIPIPDDDDPIFTAKKEVHGYMTSWSLDGFSPIDWARDHWGTKWNAYETGRASDRVIWFETAWNCPYTVITELSKKFPNETLLVQYADEDLGYNCGMYGITNGVRHDFEIDNHKEFACNLVHGMTIEELEESW